MTEMSFMFFVTSLHEKCSTSEPRAVATGQTLFMVCANSSFFNLNLWPVAIAPGSDAATPAFIYFLCKAHFARRSSGTTETPNNRTHTKTRLVTIQ